MAHGLPRVSPSLTHLHQPPSLPGWTHAPLPDRKLPLVKSARHRCQRGFFLPGVSLRKPKILWPWCGKPVKLCQPLRPPCCACVKLRMWSAFWPWCCCDVELYECCYGSKLCMSSQGFLALVLLWCGAMRVLKAFETWYCYGLEL